MDYINIGTGFTTMRRETPVELLQHCEAESVSYLDEVASNTATQDMAHTLGLEMSWPAMATQDMAKFVGLEVPAMRKKAWYRFKTVKCSLQ
ncbi:hypothetical protein SASPL_118091 [Salvia splendens]|uniref:Uncharacterized protein n=1 Tax=Salvia splendens TaxID=180675 RepID=A0A8X8Y0P2_SALSN|nr:hypothetical protein SASPL_118091 [Salvia splendens]